MKRSNPAFWASAVALGICVTASAGPISAPQSAANQHQRNNESADGGVCRTADNGDYHCWYFVAQANLNGEGEYESTRVGLGEWGYTATTNENRSLECTVVDRSILAVSPNHATVRALLDADSASCITYGNIYHWDTGESENWVYSGLIPLEAELSNPVRQWTWAYPRSYEDHSTGESLRETCVGGSSADPVEGGMLINDVYFAYGPDDVEGSFYHERCNAVSKSKEVK